MGPPQLNFIVSLKNVVQTEGMFPVFNFHEWCTPGAVVAQMASARLSEREVCGSILGDCFDFPLIRVHVAIALNIRKMEH